MKILNWFSAFLFAVSVIVTSVFAVHPTHAATSIRVISPNGGEVWNRGSTYAVTWESTGLSAVSVEMQCKSAPSLWSTGYVQNIPSGPTGGSYNITIPFWVEPDPLPNACQLRVLSDPWAKSLGVDYDKNDAPFTISGPRPNSAAEIVYPNGGEVFMPGDKVTIQWKRNWYPQGNVNVGLSADRSGYTTGTVCGSVPGNSCEYTIPQDVKPGNLYRFRVQAVTYGGSSEKPLSDGSNGNITIGTVPTSTPIPTKTPKPTLSNSPTQTPQKIVDVQVDVQESVRPSFIKRFFLFLKFW